MKNLYAFPKRPSNLETVKALLDQAEPIQTQTGPLQKLLTEILNCLLRTEASIKKTALQTAMP